MTSYSSLLFLPPIRYVITGAYVGFATVGIFIQWYLKHGVTFSQLAHWSKCLNFEGFAPAMEVRREEMG